MENKTEEILGMYRNISKHAIDILIDIHEDTSESGIKYSIERISKLFNSIDKEMSGVDFTKFTPDELKSMGFSLWDDDGLMLAPRWVFKVMRKGTILTSISGDAKVFGTDNIDLETRFGVTAWGLTKSQLRDSKLDSVIN